FLLYIKCYCITRRWGWRIMLSLGVVFALSSTAFSFHQVDSSKSSNPSVPSDEAALRAVVEKYFAVCSKKDLAGVIVLWSEKSPYLTTYKQNLQHQLTSEDLSFGSPAISRVRMESEKASLRVMIALTSINLKSQQKSEQQLVRIF